ncbi:MAG: M14 family metallopeptidase [Methylococcales bacterium]|nr:M14 family metallopeptidase [Methylococcales bacterium]
MLKIIDHVPDGFLDVDARQLHTILPQPTLMHLAGRQQPAVFVAILLHGNEDTGLKTIQQVLKKYAERELPRALSIFVGNVTAAREGLRRLDSQADFNRIWPGTEHDAPEQQAMANAVINDMQQRGVFASIDIHNNTGLNPNYSCVNTLDQRFLHLATLFSRIAVYFIRPKGTQSAAFAKLCPAIAIECSKPGNPEGIARAVDLVDACLHLADFPAHPVAAHDLDLFHTIGLVKIPEHISFKFGAGDVDLNLESAIDHLNFTEIPVGTCLGTTKQTNIPLQVLDEDGNCVAERFFEVRNGELLTRCNVIPAMLTLDERIIRQDCLCYLMERLPLSPP